MRAACDFAALQRGLEASGLSLYTAAHRVGVDPAHLYRVFRGKRAPSRALIESLAELMQPVDQPATPRQPEDIERLIGAAAHLFFLKRGRFESAICARLTRQCDE